jgi:hypothetical protein
LKIGFREIDNFKEVKTIIDELLEEIKKAMNPLSQVTVVDRKGNVPNDEELTMNTRLEQKDLGALDTEQIISERIPMKDRTQKEFVKMIIKLNLDSINFSLMGKQFNFQNT